jgi:hypothetical protein
MEYIMQKFMEKIGEVFAGSGTIRICDPERDQDTGITITLTGGTHPVYRITLDGMSFVAIRTGFVASEGEWIAKAESDLGRIESESEAGRAAGST